MKWNKLVQNLFSHREVEGMKVEDEMKVFFNHGTDSDGQSRIVWERRSAER